MTYYGPSCPVCIEGYPASVTGTEPEPWARALCEQHYRRWQERRDALDVADDGAKPAPVVTSPVSEHDLKSENAPVSIVRTIVVSVAQELEAPTMVEEVPAIEVADAIRRDLGVVPTMLDEWTDLYPVVDEASFIFRFSRKVLIRPYVKKRFDCEDQARQFTDLLGAWGSNSIILEGWARIGTETVRHRWAAAVVYGRDGLTTVMVEPRTGERVTVGYTPDKAEAYA